MYANCTVNEVDTYTFYSPVHRSGKDKTYSGMTLSRCCCERYGAKGARNVISNSIRNSENWVVFASWTVLSTGAGQTAMKTMTIQRKCVGERT